jgi:hypothetical protein
MVRISSTCPKTYVNIMLTAALAVRGQKSVMRSDKDRPTQSLIAFRQPLIIGSLGSDSDYQPL